MNKIEIQIFFAPSFPSYSEQNEEKLFYIGCSHTGFIG
jgi:hypothetical protein